ncbi:MAG: 16S rRNA (cytidine(1402)-2'-O)-methyltransferase [Gemmatimonadota bacterium]|nr:16S rRNA (cytidine(1402)-2'-O)-methyltransferase [Gemmatimonadota bacterium]
MPEAALHLVGTPIGNLADLSPRARDTLAAVAVVYAEDTRRTRKLCAALGIDAELRSLHAHNEAARVSEVVERLRAGEGCALVTDAGSPAISDPGARLVRGVVEAGLPVVSVPGPSAVTASLGLSGLPADRFLFVGFPPRKGADRRRWLVDVAESLATVVAFEAPGRLAALLSDLVEAGLAERECCVCRELTKLHEETRRGTVASLAGYYRESEVRGEVTLVLAGADPEERARRDRRAAETGAREVAEEMARRGMGTREIVRRLTAEVGVPRNRAYEIALAATGDEADGS